MSTATTPRHLTAARSSSPITALLALEAHWHTTKRSSPLLKRLGMRGAEVAALAAAMLVVPMVIHSVMLCFNEMYDFIGRRARSPYTATPWGSVVIALVLMVGWVVVLCRLGYRVDLQEQGETAGSSDAEKQRRVSWGRILGRIVIPLLLMSLTGHLAWEFTARVADPMPFVRPNRVAASDVRDKQIPI